jgi:OOP family OmpA-OmpF porin
MKMKRQIKMKKLLFLSAINAALSENVQDQTEENDKWVAGFVEHYVADSSDFLDVKGIGVEFGVKYTPNWAARLEVAYLEVDTDEAFLNDSGTRFGADVLYFLDNQVYFFGGLKNIEITDGNAMVNIGLGKHWNLGEHFDLNQYWKYGNNIQLVTEVAAYEPIASGDSNTHFGLKLGFSYAFGGTIAPSMPKDADNDGVLDSKDQCADTPAGTPVDSMGCTLDLDGDGVINRLDNCPNTPAGTPVDSYGCNNDLDGDGVINSIDKCLNTTEGTRVGAKGCSLVLDTDQDGVLDDVDNCSDTPMTDKVDDKGCSIFTEEEVSINVKVLFGNNSSAIGNSNDPQFQEIANFMDRYPSTDAVIEGHASAPGREDYNLMISQKRANAVRDLLIEKYGIKALRLTAIGYGETQLLDTSNTDKANKANRRITVKVSVSNRVNVKR